MGRKQTVRNSHKTRIKTDHPVDTKEKYQPQYNLPAGWRVCIALAIYGSMALDKPWINFILGGIVGVLIYPIFEAYVYRFMGDD
jgi:hypothetical protein